MCMCECKHVLFIFVEFDIVKIDEIKNIFLHGFFLLVEKAITRTTDKSWETIYLVAMFQTQTFFTCM